MSLQQLWFGSRQTYRDVHARAKSQLNPISSALGVVWVWKGRFELTILDFDGFIIESRKNHKDHRDELVLFCFLLRGNISGWISQKESSIRPTTRQNNKGSSVLVQLSLFPFWDYYRPMKSRPLMALPRLGSLTSPLSHCHSGSDRHSSIGNAFQRPPPVARGTAGSENICSPPLSFHSAPLSKYFHPLSTPSLCFHWEIGAHSPHNLPRTSTFREI